MKTNLAIIRILWAGLLAGLAVRAGGYANLTSDSGLALKWPGSSIAIQIKADNGTRLSDGNTRATTIRTAMNDATRGWNHFLGTSQFAPQILSAGVGTEGNGVNEIFFSGSAGGEAWDANTLAVTIYNISGDRMTEADIIFNTGVSWDSYRGSLHQSAGKYTYDIQRVALHELGHVLGLDHPDERGQSVTAIMNSSISDLDSLQADDIAGGQSIYGAPGVTPANDAFANAAAITLNGGYAQLTGSNVAATKEPGEPAHAGNAGGHSIWWKWVAPASGGLNVDTGGSNFDTTLAVYTGGSVSGLTEVASNDNNPNGNGAGSLVRFLVTGGTTYYIAVDGAGGDTGSCTLNVYTYQPVAPYFYMLSSGQTMYVGQSVSYIAYPTGDPTPTVQWQRLPVGGSSWANLAENGTYTGTTTSTLTIAAATLAMSGDQFRCVATNPIGSATTSAMALTVLPLTAPSITGMPSTLAFNYGDYLNIYPTVTGPPTITIQWSKDGTPISGATSSGYSRGPLTPADSGQYTLTATNSVGSTTATVTVTVYPAVAPTIVGFPLTLAYNYGDTLSINPSVSGSPPMTYQWNKNGAAIAGATSSWFYIGAVTPADSGNYTLTVTNPAGTTTSTTLTVTVYAAVAPVINIAPTSLTVNYGENLYIYPTVTGSPPITFQWSKNGAAIPGATYGSYSIYGVTAADAGQYTLMATNVAGSTTSTVVTVTVNPPAAPVITNLPATLAVNYGEYLSINPTVSGTQPMTFQWSKDGVALPNATYSYFGLSGATSANAGQYTLSATNIAGTTVSSKVAVTINPPVAPTITNLLPAVSVNYGDSLYLYPSVSGTQPMTFQWSKDGVNLPNATSSYLSLYSVTSANAGKYTITASNLAGTTSASVAVTVNPPVAPTITGMPAALYYTAGDYLSIYPGVNGSQPITFQWKKDGVPIAGATYSNYYLSSVGQTDSGKYTLVATNVAGSASADVKVTVTPPGPPIITAQPVSQTVRAHTQAIFSVSAFGTGYVTYRWYVNGLATNNTSTSYYVYSATPADAGTYAVTATNSYGTATSSTAYLSLRTYGVDFNKDGHADLLWTNQKTGERRFWYMNGPAYGTEAPLATVSADWVAVGTGDFNGDGQADVVFRNRTTGECVVWYLNQSQYSYSTSLGIVPLEWTVVGIADFTADGWPDLLLEDKGSGLHAVWSYTYNNHGSTIPIGQIPLQWSVVGVGDFDRDGNPDVLWTNQATGELQLWLMNGPNHTGGTTLGFLPANLKLAAIDDYDGDGWPDLLLTNTTTDERLIWLMNGSVHVGTVSLGVIPPEWTPAGAPTMNRPVKLDFNGDGQADVLWENTSTGEHCVWLMNGTTFGSSVAIGSLPVEWRIAATGDFNGDGQPDLLWENTGTGERYLWLMNGPNFASGLSLATLPVEWRIAATGDFNGDGQPDIVWENTATGERYVWLMNGTTFASSVYLGTVSTDWRIAAAADYNGDGQPDIVWENTATGERYVWLMNGTTFSSSVFLGVVPTEWRVAR